VTPFSPIYLKKAMFKKTSVENYFYKSVINPIVDKNAGTASARLFGGNLFFCFVFFLSSSIVFRRKSAQRCRHRARRKQWRPTSGARCCRLAESAPTKNEKKTREKNGMIKIGPTEDTSNNVI
jgi:hypothetical protein